MNKVLAAFSAMVLAACAATPAPPLQAAVDPVFPEDAAATPAGVCQVWGSMKDGVAESAWSIIRTVPGGAEQAGKLNLVIAPNGDLSGQWIIGDAKGDVSGKGARLAGPTIRGRWGAATDPNANGFLLRRWPTVSIGEDEKSYCSFDGEYVIKGDPTRYTIKGWRLAE